MLNNALNNVLSNASRVYPRTFLTLFVDIMISTLSSKSLNCNRPDISSDRRWFKMQFLPPDIS